MASPGRWASALALSALVLSVRGDDVAIEKLPEGLNVVAITAQPATIDLKHKFDYRQVLVTGQLDTGETVAVTGPLLIGRDPDPASAPGAEPHRLLDESRSLSKTHALLTPTAHGLEVVDRGSTNGSAVVRAGVETAAVAGVALSAAVGDTVRLGDRLAEVVAL